MFYTQSVPLIFLILSWKIQRVGIYFKSELLPAIVTVYLFLSLELVKLRIGK